MLLYPFVYVFVCILHYAMSIAAWIAGAMQVLIRLWIMLTSADHYSADSMVCFVNTYPLDSDLSQLAGTGPEQIGDVY